MTAPRSTVLPEATPLSHQRAQLRTLLPHILWATAFLILFIGPLKLLAIDWWTDPEAGHGLLLAPAALWLGWKKGIVTTRAAQPLLGTLVLVMGVVLRLASELAAERFTMRFAVLLAAAGLVVFFFGLRQLLAWWLPFVLLTLSIPLPELLRSALALPLQFKASALGAQLLEWRNVPVHLAGNIIQLPGHRLFVTEACSGLRSLTALLSLGVLMGGVWLKTPWLRLLLLAVTVPIAVLLNGVRVFLTGFLVFYVDPALGDGFMHMTEGWLLFLVSFGLVAGMAVLLRSWERWREASQQHA